MYTFPKGISTMWNVKSFVQELNSVIAVSSSYDDNDYITSASFYT